MILVSKIIQKISNQTNFTELKGSFFLVRDGQKERQARSKEGERRRGARKARNQNGGSRAKRQTRRKDLLDF
jgi:hypothetical protein